MAKFNVVQKHRRSAIAERKREAHGNPLTKKLKQRPQPLSVSGKRKRKLFKKWRREQKEAVEKGMITMQDVEMAVADDASKRPAKFHMKKTPKLQVRTLKKNKGRKSKGKANRQATRVSTDAMEE